MVFVNRCGEGAGVWGMPGTTLVPRTPRAPSATLHRAALCALDSNTARGAGPGEHDEGWGECSAGTPYAPTLTAHGHGWLNKTPRPSTSLQIPRQRLAANQRTASTTLTYQSRAEACSQSVLTVSLGITNTYKKR